MGALTFEVSDRTMTSTKLVVRPGSETVTLTIEDEYGGPDEAPASLSVTISFERWEQLKKWVVST